MIAKPDRSEYADYYDLYVSKLPDGDVLDILESQIAGTTGLLSRVGEDKAGHRYAPDKWSIKQVVGHVIDAESVFASRALWFARGNEAPLPSFEQDENVEAANFDEQMLQTLVEQLRVTRAATVAMFRSFDDDMLMRKGTASGCVFTVRAIAAIIAGHELHHKMTLEERYL